MMQHDTLEALTAELTRIRINCGEVLHICNRI